MSSCEIVFNYPSKVIFFRDSLRLHSPFVFREPRNHESLFLVTNGTLLYEKEGVRELVQTGQVGYIARGSVDRSGAYACPEVSYIAMNFHFDRVNPVPTPTLPFPTVCADDPQSRYEKLFSLALHTFVSQNVGYNLICDGIAVQIIGMLFESLAGSSETSMRRQQIAVAVEYMKDNCEDPALKVRDAAARLEISEKSFRRKFVAAYGCTPYAFLQQFRVDKAASLLINTAKPIWDIALQCGFSDVYSFSHCFKHHMGVPASKYREEQSLLNVHRRTSKSLPAEIDL